MDIVTSDGIVFGDNYANKLVNMLSREIVFQKFGRVILKLLRGLLRPLGGLWVPRGSILGASLGPLGGLLGASWGPLGAVGGRFDVKDNFETLEIFGRAVLESSWG